MPNYLVTLIEEYNILNDDETILFDCFADDVEHAKEQTLNAYPECKIINVQEI